MNKTLEKIIRILVKIICICAIVCFAYSLTPKTFQNDTYYTIKIGEHIDRDTEHFYDLLPWNKGLDMKDHFSYHNLPYTYPHWLYDFLTYKIYSLGGFSGVYHATCILAIALGISIYLVNIRFSKNDIVSFLFTIASLYALKNFITARAQLVTFILFVFTIYGIEQFIKTKKIRYAILLVIIPILIANLHCAVWPFYFVLYAPYIAEWLCISIATANYKIIADKIKLFYKTKIKKTKISELQINIEKNKIRKAEKKHKENLEKNLEKTHKIKVVKESGIKWLVLLCIICAFTGLLTPLKGVPYTYLLKTNQGNTTANISEHLPLILINNEDMIIILAIIFGILIFSKTKIKLRDFFMLMGLIALSFMSQRQVSMLVVIGNFIVVRLVCNIMDNFKQMLKVDENSKSIRDFNLAKVLCTIVIAMSITIISFSNYLDKKNDVFVDEEDYPVAASEFIKTELIPKIGVENLRLYNEYNYGSYLLFQEIPVFIDSRADLYAPEFNGNKDGNGEYIGNDIFSDYIGISRLSEDYEEKFEEYNITHVITYSDSKLSSLLKNDDSYVLLYDDENFKVYERVSIYG